VKRPKFRRFGVSTGTKVQQTNMRRLAKDMAKDPKMLIPECLEDCGRCQFDKLHLKFTKIQKFKDHMSILNKLARGGKQLERGYASMLILAAEDMPIKFATAKLPTGDVNYTVRGKVKREVQIGLQHFDDVELGLLAYSEIAIKKGIYIYSSEEGLYCSGRAHYPKDLIREVLKTSNYSLKKTKNGHICEHLAGDEAHGGVLTLKIISADMSIILCQTCASKKKNIYSELTRRVITKRPERDFEIRLEHRLDCVKDDDCTVLGMSFDTAALEDRYRKGRFSDKELLKEFEKSIAGFLGTSSSRLLIAGNRCFEDDTAAFIDALRPSSIERKALEYVLRNTSESVVVDSHTSSAVLSQFWDTKGAGAVLTVTKDKELARKIYLETKDSGKTPSQILREAEMESRSKTVLEALPDLKGLGKIGTLADGIARDYKALGRDETVRSIEKAPKGETKLKSVSCGFLMSLNSLKGKEWQFTKEELDYGKYLADFTKALLESPPEDYKDALQNLLTASGSGEVIE